MVPTPLTEAAFRENVDALANLPSVLPEARTDSPVAIEDLHEGPLHVSYGLLRSVTQVQHEIMVSFRVVLVAAVFGRDRSSSLTGHLVLRFVCCINTQYSTTKKIDINADAKAACTVAQPNMEYTIHDITVSMFYSFVGRQAELCCDNAVSQWSHTTGVVNTY